jgi:TetR/AcrR family transcriptional regulator, transcriptional repressor for nem operon
MMVIILKKSTKNLENAMVRYDKSHHAETHKSIVNAASALLREKGFTETSVGTVMKSVGLTHGGFYAHFEDKTAMLVAAITEAFVESPKNFKLLSNIATTSGDVGVIAKHYLAVSRVKDVATGCPAAALVSELPRQEEPVKDAFQFGTAETMRALADAPGLSENSTAWAALSMLVGGLTLMRAFPNAKTNDTIRNQIIDGLRKLAKPEDAK